MSGQIKRHRVLFTLLLSLVVWCSAMPAQAALDPVAFTGDLDSLVLQGNDLVAQMGSLTLAPFSISSQLADLETSVNAYGQSVSTVFDTVVAASGTSLTLTDEMLVSLQTLATINASLGNGILALSGQVVTLAPTTMLSALNSSLYSMLRLSDDIGTMADRILEMADKILVMADDIGLMADRILATQLIQNSNIELVVDATLKTQQNTLMLFGMFF